MRVSSAGHSRAAPWKAGEKDRPLISLLRSSPRSGARIVGYRQLIQGGSAQPAAHECCLKPLPDGAVAIQKFSRAPRPTKLATFLQIAGWGLQAECVSVSDWRATQPAQPVKRGGRLVSDMPTIRQPAFSARWRVSVLRRPFDVIDYQRLDRAFGRFESKSELVAQRLYEARPVGGGLGVWRGRRGISPGPALGTVRTLPGPGRFAGSGVHSIFTSNFPARPVRSITRRSSIPIPGRDHAISVIVTFRPLPTRSPPGRKFLSNDTANSRE